MKTIRLSLFVAFCLTIVAASASSIKATGTPSAKPTPTPSVVVQTKQARLAYKRLLDLKAALDKIPMEKQDKPPHKAFLRANDKKIVYSEPAGAWFVRSDLFWELSDKYKHLPVGDDIAWTAAQNPLPGECEGEITCYVYNLHDTEGRYLKAFPNGKFSNTALENIADSLAMFGEDKANYDGPTEPSDRAELKKMLTELAAIIDKTEQPQKTKALLQIKRLGERYEK